MSLYFDNAAAAPCSRETLEAFCRAQETFFGNQEASGFHGRCALDAVKAAEKKLVSCFSEDPGTCVFWGNTGTDVLAAAVYAVQSHLKGCIVTTELEHPALIRALEQAAEKNGAKICFCPVDRCGAPDLPFLSTTLKTEKVSLVALHHIQSETGRMQDLNKIRACMDQAGSKALFLADTIQSAGKYPLPWDSARLDFAFVSGQKIGCPGGAAVLYRSPWKKDFAALRGTEHLCGRCLPGAAVTLADTMEKLSAEQEKNLSRMKELKQNCMQALTQRGLKFRNTIPDGDSSAYILHLMTEPYQGAILIRMLSGYGISAASGSACESEAGGPSRALKSMGIGKKESYCALRLSFWLQNTPEECAEFAGAMTECAAKY